MEQDSSLPAAPATMTRSMSRRSLSAVQPRAHQQQHVATSASSKFPSSSRPAIGLSSRPSSRALNVAGIGAPSRSRAGTENIASLREGSSSRATAARVPEEQAMRRTIKPLGSAASGMGVRRGPAVVRSASSSSSSTVVRQDQRVRSLSPAKLSPPKLATPVLSSRANDSTMDPFSVNFQAKRMMFEGMATALEPGRKRGLEPVEDKGAGKREDGESPAKRVHLAEPPTFRLTTPGRSTSSPRQTVSSYRIRANTDENAVPVQLQFHSAGVVSPQAPRMAMGQLPPSPTLRSPSRALKQKRKEVPTEGKGELSPRKRVAGATEDEVENRGAAGAAGLRSPMQRKRVATVPLQRGKGPTSVPISRPSFSLASMTFDSPAAPHVVPDTAVLPPAAPRTSLPSKYSRLPSTRPPATGSSISALATSQPMRRSGIPRPAALATSFPPVYNPHASSSTSRAPRLSQSHPDPVAMQEDEEVGDTTVDAGNVSIGSMSMSEETASRLAKLQTMLARLAMPRQSVGGATTGSGTLGGAKRASLGGPSRASSTVMTSSNTRIGRRATMTGTFREEYTMPLAAGDNLSSMAPPASTLPRPAKSRASLPGPPPAASTASSSSFTNLRHSVPLPRAAESAVLAPTSASTARPVSTTSHIKPPRRTSLLPSSSSTAALNALALPPPPLPLGEQITFTAPTKPEFDFLSGVVAFVDVRTLEGDEAGMVFVDILRNRGARVTTRPTQSLTHIIYKSGRPGTLVRHRAMPDPKPFLVGISWVVRCAELGERVDEVGHLILEDKEVGRVVPKRRRSMEPRRVSGSAGTVGTGGGLLAGNVAGLNATIAASIARARRRSLQFQPKIGSPLAKRVFTMVVPEEGEEQEEEDQEMF